MKHPLYTIDATGKPLGRIASEVASLLRGKREATFTPNLAPTVRVHVTNIAQLKFTGGKLDAVRYYRHTMKPRGLRSVSMRESFERDPKIFFANVVKRMLPATKHRTTMLRNLLID